MDKILLIDDSLTVRMELKQAFAGEGYEIYEAENGEKAIETFRATSDIKLIICDYNMPGKDGLTTISDIFQINPEKPPLALMLTTESSKTLKTKGREIGISGWILKPYNKEVLLTGVRSILQKHKQA